MSIIEQLKAHILDNCPFGPTADQDTAAGLMARFVCDADSESVFLLHGYAGTGKTSLVAALVRALRQLGRKTVLLAPTGRAAKVFGMHAGQAAYTIHKRIYRQKAFNGEATDFAQGYNSHRGTLFIVDEASMIANTGYQNSMFGTGCLLDDLMHYVYGGAGCRVMLVGDTAQLPPVGEDVSPALEAGILAGYGMRVYAATLEQVVRQADASGILYNATMLRRLIAANAVAGMPQMRLKGFADIRRLPGSELIEALEQAYYRSGKEETIVITRSNDRANRYNQGIRSRILGCEEEMSSGDHLLIVKNNYHWLKLLLPEQQTTAEALTQLAVKGDTEASGAQHTAADEPADGLDATDEQLAATLKMDFLANGDVAIVRRFRNERSEHGFRFVDATLTFPDYDGLELEATLLLDTLMSPSPALTRAQQQQLFDSVWADYPEISTRRERMKAVQADPLYNALQVKFAYAVTCHKAQGGQWQQVFIDQGYMTDDMLDADYLRWLYTAITRATERVYLVNWPKEGLDAESRTMADD